jgi:transcriptional regulator with XRE-family HTH domain
MDEILKEKLSEKLRSLRNKHGYSQEYMAQVLGKNDHTAYQRIETGRTEIKLDDFVKLAKIFSIPLDDLLNLDEPPVRAKVNDYKQVTEIPFTVILNGDLENFEKQVVVARQINQVLNQSKL